MGPHWGGLGSAWLISNSRRVAFKRLPVRRGKVKYFLVQATWVSDFSTVYYSQADSLKGMQKSTSKGNFKIFVHTQPGISRA